MLGRNKLIGVLIVAIFSLAILFQPMINLADTGEGDIGTGDNISETPSTTGEGSKEGQDGGADEVNKDGKKGTGEDESSKEPTVAPLDGFGTLNTNGFEIIFEDPQDKEGFLIVIRDSKGDIFETGESFEWGYTTSQPLVEGETYTFEISKTGYQTYTTTFVGGEDDVLEIPSMYLTGNPINSGETMVCEDITFKILGADGGFIRIEDSDELYFAEGILEGNESIFEIGNDFVDGEEYLIFITVGEVSKWFEYKFQDEFCEVVIDFKDGTISTGGDTGVLDPLPEYDEDTDVIVGDEEEEIEGTDEDTGKEDGTATEDKLNVCVDNDEEGIACDVDDEGTEDEGTNEGTLGTGNGKDVETIEGDDLPDTATNMYNTLLIGILMLLIGSVGILINRYKSKNVFFHKKN